VKTDEERGNSEKGKKKDIGRKREKFVLQMRER
jgi:hypothetical protein